MKTQSTGAPATGSVLDNSAPPIRIMRPEHWDLARNEPRTFHRHDDPGGAAAAFAVVAAIAVLCLIVGIVVGLAWDDAPRPAACFGLTGHECAALMGESK